MARTIVTHAPTIESVRVYQVGGGRGVRKCTRIRPNGILDQDNRPGRPITDRKASSPTFLLKVPGAGGRLRRELAIPAGSS